MDTTRDIPGLLPRFDPADRPHGVLVGVDGSPDSLAALHFAAEAARLRGVRLTVVTTYRLPRHIYPNYASLPTKDEDSVHEARAQRVLEAAREETAGHPGEMSFLLAVGHATDVLKRMSAEAQLTVVGSRGRGGFIGMLVGSVATALPPHAASPVVVVPAAGDPDGAGPNSDRPVLAAVDGSAASRLVEIQAAQAAEERGTGLQIMMIMPPPDTIAGWYSEVVTTAHIDTRRAELREWLDSERHWVEERFSELTISCSLDFGDPISTLADHARSASLTVIGSRGRGAVTGTVLGSISRELLQRKVGAVMVVPGLHDSRVGDSVVRPG